MPKPSVPSKNVCYNKQAQWWLYTCQSLQGWHSRTKIEHETTQCHSLWTLRCLSFYYQYHTNSHHTNSTYNYHPHSWLYLLPSSSQSPHSLQRVLFSDPVRKTYLLWDFDESAIHHRRAENQCRANKRNPQSKVDIIWNALTADQTRQHCKDTELDNWARKTTSYQPYLQPAFWIVLA